MSEFIWTEELATEYAAWCLNRHTIKDIDKFKKSKQPKLEWEILTYSHFQSGIHAAEPCCARNGHCKIYSVKRLSDGEVFTVGDKVDIRPKDGSDRAMEPMTISKFSIEADEMIVYDWCMGYKLWRLIHSIAESSIHVLLTPSEIEKLKELLKK